jgi:hypothetical protein
MLTPQVFVCNENVTLVSSHRDKVVNEPEERVSTSTFTEEKG